MKQVEELDARALAGLLIAKGVITTAEWADALTQMEAIVAERDNVRHISDLPAAIRDRLMDMMSESLNVMTRLLAVWQH